MWALVERLAMGYARLLCILVFLSLSGCSGSVATTETQTPISPHPSSTQATPCTTCSTGPLSLPKSLDFVGCAGIAGDIAVQTDKARPLVPADYPLDPLTPIATLIGMEWMTCESVAVGNTTVAKGITFAELQIVVTPPKDVQGPGLNLYLPEFILSAGPVLDLLNQFGFEAQDGTASCTSTQATLTCSLTAAGLRYDLTQAGDVDPNGVSVEETVRMHHEAGRHAWFNETKGGPEAQYSSPGTVTASGGRLAQLLAGNPGVFAGQVTSNKSLHLELNTT